MPSQIKDILKKQLEDVSVFLQNEFGKLQIGRASASLIDSIPVDAYGTSTPLKGLANIIVQDAKTILIQPWDKGSLSAIEKAILASDLGLNPVNEGISLRLVLPELTGERREQLVKVSHELLEKAKISIRQHRHDAHQKLKNLEKDKEISEDDGRREEKYVQDLVDECNQKVEEMGRKKENDIKTV